MDAILAAGGGRMLIPEGVYRGRIVIPPVSKPAPCWITVEIVGEGSPTPVFGTIGNFPLRDKGTILKCLDKKGSAVISAEASPDSLYGGFSAVHVVIENLDVRTYDDPAIGGIDLHYAMQCRLENVFINTGIYNVQSAIPTHGTQGLVTPANNNAALTLLRNVTVTGYHTGIVVNEHTHGDHIILGSNIHGLEFATAHHASRFDRVSSMRNTHHVTVTGKHGFSISQLNIENAGPGQTDAHNGWQKLACDLNDPQNLGTGDITYWVVIRPLDRPHLKRRHRIGMVGTPAFPHRPDRLAAEATFHLLQGHLDLPQGAQQAPPPARPLLRGVFTPGKKIVRAIAHTTALGIYELHVNGQRVGDTYFAPGWTDCRKRIYYNTYDLTPLLQDGNNTIGAIVADGWYSGYIGYGKLVGYGPHQTGRDIYGKTPSLMRPRP